MAKYISYGEINQDTDYLLIGYTNRFGQLDVAKLPFSLLQKYYITSNEITQLCAQVGELETFLSNCLTQLSSENGEANKMTVSELSAYCSYNRYNEMRDARTFVNTDDFMDYLKNSFQDINQVSADTRLSIIGRVLTKAANQIWAQGGIFSEAFTAQRT